MSPTLTALAFTISGVRLGLKSDCVRKVLWMMELQTAPELPPLVAGFLHFQSELIPVIRLHRLLHTAGHDETVSFTEHLNSRLVLCRAGNGALAWPCEQTTIITYRESDVTRIPADHALNGCAEWVISSPGQPPITLLEPSRLLLEKERVCLEEFQSRIEERISSLTPSA